MNTNDGGPAFPLPHGTELATFMGPGGTEYKRTVDVAKGGMSLRAYLAAKAMQGMLAASALNNTSDGDVLDPNDEYVDRVAATATRMADAMLKAPEAK